VALILNTATGLLILAGAVWFIAGPLAMLRLQRRSNLGIDAFTPTEVALDVRGRPHPILAKDSVAFILLLDAACGACRVNAKAYLAFASWARLQGAASRLLLPNSQIAGAQYGRLAGDENAIWLVQGALFERLGVLATPSTLLVDAGGHIRARWLGSTPGRLDGLKALEDARR